MLALSFCEECAGGEQGAHGMLSYIFNPILSASSTSSLLRCFCSQDEVLDIAIIADIYSRVECAIDLDIGYGRCCYEDGKM